MSTKETEESIIKEVAARFRTERMRLGMSQYDVAQLCGVTSRSIISWENGVKIPSHHLAQLAQHDFDVRFVLMALKDEDNVTDSETSLNPIKNLKIIELFEALNENQQNEVLAVAEEKKRFNDLLEKVNQLQSSLDVINNYLANVVSK